MYWKAFIIMLKIILSYHFSLDIDWNNSYFRDEDEEEEENAVTAPDGTAFKEDDEGKTTPGLEEKEKTTVSSDENKEEVVRSKCGPNLIPLIKLLINMYFIIVLNLKNMWTMHCFMIRRLKRKLSLPRTRRPLNRIWSRTRVYQARCWTTSCPSGGTRSRLSEYTGLVWGIHDISPLLSGIMIVVIGSGHVH